MQGLVDERMDYWRHYLFQFYSFISDNLFQFYSFITGVTICFNSILSFLIICFNSNLSFLVSLSVSILSSLSCVEDDDLRGVYRFQVCQSICLTYSLFSCINVQYCTCLNVLQSSLSDQYALVYRSFTDTK